MNFFLTRCYKQGMIFKRSMKILVFLLFFSPSAFTQLVSHFELKTPNVWQKIQAVFADSVFSSEDSAYLYHSGRSTRIQKILAESSTPVLFVNQPEKKVFTLDLQTYHVYYFNQKPIVFYHSYIENSRMGSCGDIRMEHYYLLEDEGIKQLFGSQNQFSCYGEGKIISYQEMKKYFKPKPVTR